MRSLANRFGALGREQFTYIAERDVFICPQGKDLTHFADSFRGRQAVYKPKRGTGQGCALKPECAPGRSDRAVIRRWEAGPLEALQEHLDTAHARRMMRRRKVISEQTFADAKERHGLARRQFRSRGKVQVQALLTAAAMNREEAGPSATSTAGRMGHNLAPDQAARRRYHRAESRQWRRQRALIQTLTIVPRRGTPHLLTPSTSPLGNNLRVGSLRWPRTNCRFTNMGSGGGQHGYRLPMCRCARRGFLPDMAGSCIGRATRFAGHGPALRA
jgi:hypothetical protein